MVHFFLGFWWGFAAYSQAASVPHDVCPTTELEWMANRAKLAEELTPDYLQFKLVKPNLVKWQKCFKESEKLFRSRDALRACFQLHQTMLAKKLEGWAAEEKLGQIDKKKYVASVSAHTKISLELSDPKLLAWLDKGEFDSAEKYLDELNEKRKAKNLPPYEYVKFRANAPTLPGQNKKYPADWRFLISDPGNPKALSNTEKWINFVVPEETHTDSMGATQISVVATHTDSKGNHATYFADHSRSVLENGLPKVVHNFDSGAKEVSSLDCLTCHISGGPLPIYRIKKVAPKYQKALESINNRMRQFSNTLDPVFPREIFQRGIFLEPKHLSSSSIRECFSQDVRATVTDSSIEKIRSSLNCKKCHDGETRSLLPDTDEAHFVSNMVENGLMPPGAHLTPEENLALRSCLWIGNLSRLMRESLNKSPCSLTETTDRKSGASTHSPK